MNTLNHAAVGAGIALVIKQPMLVLPLAFLSHFVLDALPHNGASGNGGYSEAFKHKWNIAVTLTIDFVGLPILVYLLLGQSWYVWVAAVLAVSPDLKWPYRYWLYERKGLEPPRLDPLSKFHQKIQWCERQWGIVIEFVFAVFILFAVSRLA